MSGMSMWDRATFRETVSWRGVSRLLVIGMLAVAGAGCGQEAGAPPTATEPAASGAGEAGETVAAATLPASLFLAEAPEGAVPITELKETASEGDEVVVRAVIGGRVDPIVSGRASAAIVDAGLENICVSDDDHCPTPWDYCCAPRDALTANLATMQVLDDTGRVLAADMSKQLPPLSTVTLRGVVGPRPDSQVLTIAATGVYVEAAGE